MEAASIVNLAVALLCWVSYRVIWHSAYRKGFTAGERSAGRRPND